MYHVTIASLGVGDEITPGRYSSMTRCFRPGAPAPSAEAVTYLLWEMAFESARRTLALDKPSRLESIYLWESLEAAQYFQAKYRPGSRIVRVEFDETSKLHRGDFDLYSKKHYAKPYVDFMPEAAAQYWLTEPQGTVEILVEAKGRIIEVLSDT